MTRALTTEVMTWLQVPWFSLSFINTRLDAGEAGNLETLMSIKQKKYSSQILFSLDNGPEKGSLTENF